MKGKKLCSVIAAVAAAGCLCGALALTGCENDFKSSLCLSLSFDEGQGKYAKDSSGNLKDAKISYIYNDAEYIQPRDPEWRDKGVKGGCLLFDGYSSGISYSGDEYTVSGNQLTISAYVAPRMFEWDDPNGKKNGTEQITPIVSQSYHTDGTGEGVMLGYWRFGELSFQFGAGGNWYRLWSGDKRLNKYEWNHVAGVFDGKNGTASLYLNGERVAYTEFDKGTKLSKPSDEELHIGYTGEGERLHHVSGLLDEVNIWKVALPEEYIEDTFRETELPEIDFEDIWVMNILTDDPYKTQFHGGPYQMWTNETHAPVYYNGVYHIFHQFNMAGPFFRQLCWGHFTSTDMVNWTPRKEVITPMPDSVCPDGVWSGAAINDVNNVPVLFFTAGNDSFRDDGLISNQNIGYAYPKDLTDPYLTEWVVGDELAIAQKAGEGQAGEFRDAHVWREDGVYYMTVCSSRNGQGCVLLYESDSIEVDYNAGDVDMNWVYRGVLYQLDSSDWNADYGTSWELPVMLPISNAKNMHKHILVISPAPASTADNNIYYFLGTFDKITGRFIPDEDYKHAPKRFDYGPNVFTGPSAMLDEKGDMYLFSISQDYRSESEVRLAGWACSMSLVRKVTLSDDGKLAHIDAVSALKENYVTTLVDKENLSLDEANAELAAVNRDMLYLSVTFTGITKDTKSVSVRVKSNANGSDYTDFTYDCVKEQISSVTVDQGAQGKGESNDMKDATFEIKDGTLTMEIYIDRSLIETFFDARLAITMRSYAAPSSTKIVVSAQQEEGATGEVSISRLKAGAVKSIYQ